MEFQKEELNEILNIFQQESMEIIASMDGKLLMLEQDIANSEIAIQLFRDAHSLKGSARMLGFDDIQNVAHKIEDVISLIKEEKLAVEAHITDVISECLEFVSLLINKTVAQKEEFKSPDIQIYLDKLNDVYKKAVENSETQKNEYEMSYAKKEFIKNLDEVEKDLIAILLCVSKAAKEDKYESMKLVEEKTFHLSIVIENINDEKINQFKDLIYKIQVEYEKFIISDNKSFAFLDLNNSVIALVEAVSNYCDKEHIKRKNYYEIVDSLLDKTQEEIVKIGKSEQRNEKIDKIIEKIDALQSDVSVFPEFNDILLSFVALQNNERIKKLCLNVKDIIAIFQDKNSLLAHDVALGVSEIFNILKKDTEESLKEAEIRANVIKTMTNFNNKEHIQIHKPSETTAKPSVNLQKDIITTLSNSEIKTLRVDSAKLDNLVGQVGELIVSKIKTNEQLSLTKKMSAQMVEWQKNFAKMSYYIKYFDKKFLSNPTFEGAYDYQKVVAYNKQLSQLCDGHNEKILEFIKTMSNLFKQLQESETKLNSTTTEIENMVKNMRILPLSTIFQLFPRMVHNIARDRNKKIDLIIEGQDIAADKTIIEEIKIPLIHIIRNAIDHGIEDVETRKKLGKNPIGQIKIVASYTDNKVVIDVQDDGKGLDIEKIKEKALEKRLLTQEELSAIDDDELTNLIFYPGFSTEDFVTELSGRGLGLDIVNNKINHLQGRIDIFSQVNQGTLVRITLPATVATKKVFIIEEQEQFYAIETSVIKTIARINIDQIYEKDGKNYYIYNENPIVIYGLSQILNLEETQKQFNKCTLMIIETDSTIFGIVVEKLISDQEIVHKKLSAPLYHVKHISGITTLANGEACLIINIGDVIDTINSKKIKTKMLIKNDFIRAQDNIRFKILVLDDSHTTRILQKNILSNRGYNVVSATNGADALAKVAQTKFDLIVSDLQMPGMNGFEFICELRKMQEYEKTPVVMVSSENPDHYKDEIKKTRIIKFIQKKTFRQDEFIKIIENALMIY